MVVFTSGYYRMKDNFTMLRMLKNQSYRLDFDAIIDKMAKRLVANEPFCAAAGVVGDMTLGEIKANFSDSREYLANLALDIEDDVADAEYLCEVVAQAADGARRRLIFDAVAASAFLAAGVLCASMKARLPQAICLLAASVMGFSFLDELDFHRRNLDERFEDVRLACNAAARDIITLATTRANHNYLFEIMRERFGDLLTEPTVNLEDLLETYDPNTELSDGDILVH